MPQHIDDAALQRIEEEAAELERHYGDQRGNPHYAWPISLLAGMVRALASALRQVADQPR